MEKLIIEVKKEDEEKFESAFKEMKVEYMKLGNLFREDCTVYAIKTNSLDEVKKINNV